MNQTGLDELLAAVAALPTVHSPEIDGEESDGTPRYYRNRPFVSRTQLERLLRARWSADGVAPSQAPSNMRRVLPNPGSPEASAMLDSLLAEYNWPANSKNAARAGWEAAERWLKLPGNACTAPSQAPTPPNGGVQGTDNALPKLQCPEGYCLDPQGRMSVPQGGEPHWSFGYELGYREAFKTLQRAALSHSTAALGVKGMEADRVKRLQAAIEGECNGLAIVEQHARAILQYVDGVLAVAPTRDRLAPLLNAYGELQWRSGRGDDVSHDQIAEAFEAVIAAGAQVFHVADPQRQRELAAIEANAREIYDGWKAIPGWVPWVEGGNSHRQDDARAQALARGVTVISPQVPGDHTPMGGDVTGGGKQG